MRLMFGSKDVTIVNNCIDTDMYKFNGNSRESIRTKHHWNHCKVLGHVGIFIELKNQTFVVDVFNVLYKKDDTYRLVLIGEGPLHNTIKAKVQQLGLADKVVFTGNINNVNEYLNAIDIIIMPSYFEGLPLTLIEQQANGLQCVCSDTITKEVDKSGNLRFLSLDKSADEWALEVDSFLDTSHREERSRIAIEKIRESGYSIQAEAEKLLKLYRRLVR